MNLGSLMQGLEGLAGSHAAEIGSHVGLSPEQVTEIMGHLSGQASQGQTDPQAAAQQTAQQTGIDPGAVMNVVAALQHGGGINGVIETVQSNPAMLSQLMNMAKGFLNR